MISTTTIQRQAHVAGRARRVERASAVLPCWRREPDVPAAPTYRTTDATGRCTDGIALASGMRNPTAHTAFATTEHPTRHLRSGST